MLEFLTSIYWPSVIGLAFIEIVATSAWIFGGNYGRLMDDVYEWADLLKLEACALATVGILILLVGACFASFWAMPIYVAIGLGYFLSYTARKREEARKILREAVDRR